MSKLVKSRTSPAWTPGAAERNARSSVRRVGAVVGACSCLATVVVALLTTTWLTTPSTADAVHRAEEIARTHGGTPIGPNDIPPTLIDAFLATEDSSFYHNHGVNLEGTARAALFDIRNRCTCEGGSGITQQLAEDLYLHGSDASLPRYWTDTVLALKIDLHMTKPEVLAAYLSEVYLGNGAYGVAAASQTYFRKPLDDLSLTQYALLAGLPRAPSAYDPILHPGPARARLREVLAAMVADHYITPAAAARAASAPL